MYRALFADAVRVAVRVAMLLKKCGASASDGGP